MNKKKEITLSIIIPMYNCEKYIKRCIESVVKQEGISLEIILIDDGSNDNTIEICEKIMSNRNNIDIVIIKQQNHGVSYSRNKGISKAKGKYIMFLDSDDYLEENSLKNIKDLLNEEIDVLRYSYKIIEKDKIKKEVFKNKTFDLLKEKEQFFNNFFSNTNQNMVWGQIIRRNLLKKIKFNEKIIYGEDILFNYELYNSCRYIKYTDVILYNYVVNNSNITHNYKYDVVKNKVYNLIEVYTYMIKNIDLMELKKIVWNKFINEIIPQIMMLMFDSDTSKKQKIKEFEKISHFEILNDKYFFKEKKVTKYMYAYNCIEKKDWNKLYFYSKLYVFLKKIKAKL